MEGTVFFCFIQSVALKLSPGVFGGNSSISKRFTPIAFCSVSRLLIIRYIDSLTCNIDYYMDFRNVQKYYFKTYLQYFSDRLIIFVLIT